MPRRRSPSPSTSSSCDAMNLDARIPTGPIAETWNKAKFDLKLVNPANKRKYSVIVVGSGLAGGAAAATLAELGYDVAQVSRTFYARGQTGQQLLIGVYQALERQIAAGKVKMFSRTEMLDLVLVDGRAAGIVVRDLVTGEIKSYSGHAVLLASGGY